MLVYLLLGFVLLGIVFGDSLFWLCVLLLYGLAFLWGVFWGALQEWRRLRQTQHVSSFFPFFGKILWYVVTQSWRRTSQEEEPPPPLSSSAELAQVLATPNAAPLTEAQATVLRPLVLHWLGLRTDLADSRIAVELPKTLRQRWYALDLQHTDAGSTPHAHLAFACLRCAFYLRAAAALGWMESDLYSHITHLNVLRVRECFANWPAFCQAFDLGRTQWRTSGRTDIFGEHLNPERLRPWLWP